MAQVVVAQRMWQRRDNAANWTSKNPVLAAGEIGVELGATPAATKIKIGDGTTPWAGLPYYAGGGGGGSAAQVTYDNANSGLDGDNVQEAIDELAGLLNDSGTGTFNANVVLSALGTTPAAGTNKAMWVAPISGVLTDLVTAVGVVATTGSTVVDMNRASDGLTVLSVKPAIDATERNSITGVPAAVDPTRRTFNKGDVFLFDLDSVGASVNGLSAVVYYRNPGSGGTVSFVWRNDVVYNVATSVSVTVSSTVLPGDLLVATLMNRSVSTTAPAGWSKLADVNAFANNSDTGANKQNLAVYYKIATVSDIGTPLTFTQADSQRIAVSVSAFRTAQPDTSPAIISFNSTFANNVADDSQQPTAPLTVPGGASMVLAFSTVNLANSSGVTNVTAPYGTLITPPSVADNRLFGTYASSSPGVVRSGNFVTNVTSTAAPGGAHAAVTIAIG